MLSRDDRCGFPRRVSAVRPKQGLDKGQGRLVFSGERESTASAETSRRRGIERKQPGFGGKVRRRCGEKRG